MMPTCEHGHEHNLFMVDGAPHNCKKCGVCQYLISEEKAKPTNKDLLDTLINDVIEAAEIENLPRATSEAQAEAMADLFLSVPEKNMEALREKMRNTMHEWVKEVFRR